jgi:hypothetical protein
MIPIQRLSLLVLLASLTIACGGSTDPRELNDAGNKALNSGDSKAAAESFDKALTALAGKTDDPLYRAAKLGAIEARIKLDAKAATAEFLEYAKASPSTVRDVDYIDISGKLASSNAISEALDVVKQGMLAFPDSAKMKKQEVLIVEKAKSQGDPGLNDKLKGLGYLGK